jgi:hypothetical protein
LAAGQAKIHRGQIILPASVSELSPLQSTV